MNTNWQKNDIMNGVTGRISTPSLLTGPSLSRSTAMPNTTSTVSRVCEYCGKDFPARTRSVAQGYGRFCCRSCYMYQRGRDRRGGCAVIPHPTDSDAVLIPLSRDKFAAVDKVDLPLIDGGLWSAVKPDNRWYAARNIDGRQITMHRVLCGDPEGMYVDHKNHDGLDNRRTNLRVCTNADNGRNRASISARNTSGYVGVWFNKLRQRWIANISIGGRTIHVGSYATAKEAAIARDAKAREVYGEFATLNFPDRLSEGH